MCMDKLFIIIYTVIFHKKNKSCTFWFRGDSKLSDLLVSLIECFPIVTPSLSTGTDAVASMEISEPVGMLNAFWISVYQARLCFSAWVLCSDIVLHFHYCCFISHTESNLLHQHSCAQITGLIYPFTYTSTRRYWPREAELSKQWMRFSISVVVACFLAWFCILCIVFQYNICSLKLILCPLLNSLNQSLFWLKLWFSNFLTLSIYSLEPKRRHCKRMQKHHTCHVSYKKWSIQLNQFIICYLKFL